MHMHIYAYTYTYINRDVAEQVLKQAVRRLLDDSAAFVWEGRQEGVRWEGPLFATGWALGSNKSCPPSLSSQASATHALLGHAVLLE